MSVTITNLVNTGVGLVKHSSVILTDAQIKALPTTPIEIIPVKPANVAAFPLFINCRIKWVADYTNIANGPVDFCIIGFAPSAIALASGPLTYLEEDTATAKASFLLAPGRTGSTFFMPTQFLFSAPNPTTDFFYGASDYPDVNIGVGDSLQMKARNGALGDFTGGNAGNSLKVDVWYVDLIVN